MLVSGVGFSNGCAAFMLKKKLPPLVPICLIDSKAATAPTINCCCAFQGRNQGLGGEGLWHALPDIHQRYAHAQRQHYAVQRAGEVDPEVTDIALNWMVRPRQ